MEVNIESGGTLVRAFTLRIEKGNACRHFPLTSRLWWLKVSGNILQEGLSFVIMLAISVITISLELAGNLIALFSIAFFYLIKKVIDFIFWGIKLILETIFGSVGKGLSILFIAFAFLLIYYIYTTGLWQRFFEQLDLWFSSVQQ